MMGNWTVSKEEIDNEVFDDFCFGFLYLTTPEGDYDNIVSIIEIIDV